MFISIIIKTTATITKFVFRLLTNQIKFYKNYGFGIVINQTPIPTHPPFNNLYKAQEPQSLAKSQSYIAPRTRCLILKLSQFGPWFCNQRQLSKLKVYNTYAGWSIILHNDGSFGMIMHHFAWREIILHDNASFCMMMHHFCMIMPHPYCMIMAHHYCIIMPHHFAW